MDEINEVPLKVTAEQLGVREGCVSAVTAIGLHAEYAAPRTIAV